jgi:hypothetical protein
MRKIIFKAAIALAVIGSGIVVSSLGNSLLAGCTGC